MHMSSWEFLVQCIAPNSHGCIIFTSLESTQSLRIYCMPGTFCINANVLETGGMVSCPPHQFQCGSQDCVDQIHVCNHNADCADGSDEGVSCEIKCAADSRCSQGCYNTPRGPVRTLYFQCCVSNQPNLSNQSIPKQFCKCSQMFLIDSLHAFLEGLQCNTP